MASSISTQRTEPWQRFTVLDALLLQVGYALAFSFVLSPYREVAFKALDAGSLFLIITTLCLGSAICGPIILGAHWLVRGRRIGLSAGEWLWLSPAAIVGIGLLGIWALHWVAHALPDSEEVRAISYAMLGLVLFLVEIGCMVNALLVVMARLVGDLKGAPCQWADAFGAVTCLLVGTLVVLILLAVLS